MSNMLTYNTIYEEILSEAEETTKDNSSYELIFSSNLASEFTRTVNEFTSICAKMVQEKNINKELAEKFDESYSKIKNLVDAAKNS